LRIHNCKGLSLLRIKIRKDRWMMEIQLEKNKPEEIICQRCGSAAIARMTAKCDDRFGMRWPGGKIQTGHVLPHELIGLRENGADHDHVNMSWCLACGQIQGEWPTKIGKKYLKAEAILDKEAGKKKWMVVATDAQDKTTRRGNSFSSLGEAVAYAQGLKHFDFVGILEDVRIIADEEVGSNIACGSIVTDCNGKESLFSGTEAEAIASVEGVKVPTPTCLESNVGYECVVTTDSDEESFIFNTEAEAIAFADGVDFVNDSSIEVSSVARKVIK
jgi:hypothetical protein